MYASHPNYQWGSSHLPRIPWGSWHLHNSNQPSSRVEESPSQSQSFCLFPIPPSHSSHLPFWDIRQELPTKEWTEWMEFPPWDKKCLLGCSSAELGLPASLSCLSLTYKEWQSVIGKGIRALCSPILQHPGSSHQPSPLPDVDSQALYGGLDSGTVLPVEKGSYSLSQ